MAQRKRQARARPRPRPRRLPSLRVRSTICEQWLVCQRRCCICVRDLPSSSRRSPAGRCRGKRTDGKGGGQGKAQKVDQGAKTGGGAGLGGDGAEARSNGGEFALLPPLRHPPLLPLSPLKALAPRRRQRRAHCQTTGRTSRPACTQRSIAWAASEQLRPLTGYGRGVRGGVRGRGVGRVGLWWGEGSDRMGVGKSGV
jgi:hypothetical protein